MLRARFISLVLFATPAFAEESAIVVTGHILSDGQGDDGYDRIEIGRERLTKTASGRLEDALRDVAGLQQFRRTDARSANATSQGATLRGLGGNASSRALLILDGVPQADPFGGWVTWPAYDPSWIGRARVTRGGGSGVHGPGALAGSIELFSIRPEDAAKSELSLFGGSRQSLEAKASVSGALGSGFGFVAASYARGDGFIPIVASQRGSADIAAPYEQASVSARAIVPLGDATEVQGSMSGFSDRRTRGTILSGNGGEGGDASLRIVHTGAWQWTLLGYLQMRSFDSGFVSINAARTSVLQTVDQFRVPSTGMGGKIEVRPPLREGTELRLGADVRHTRGVTKERFTYVAGLPTRGREAGGEAMTMGVYAEASADLGAVTLTGGARADHWSLSHGRLREWTLATGAVLRADVAPHRTGWEPTGRAAIAIKLAQPLTVRGAAYAGWRLPTLNELYRPFRVGADATAANAALKPERMQGVDAGFDWTPAEGVSIRGTAFFNQLDDAIANVTLAAGPGVFPGVGFVAAGGAYRQRRNLDRISVRGVELDAAIRRGDWHLAASYAHSRARVKASGIAAGLHGLRPAQVPAHMASATVGWKAASLTARYVSGQFEDDGNTRSLADAFTVDATIAWPVVPDLSLILRGENLANARVEAAISGAGIVERASPRTLWFGVRWTP